MTKKIAVVGSMINSSEYLLFKNLETGYSLERYDSVEEARNSDCDAVIVPIRIRFIMKKRLFYVTMSLLLKVLI